MSHLVLKLEVANMANSELETTRAPREELLGIAHSVGVHALLRRRTVLEVVELGEHACEWALGIIVPALCARARACA